MCDNYMVAFRQAQSMSQPGWGTECSDTPRWECWLGWWVMEAGAGWEAEGQIEPSALG